MRVAAEICRTFLHDVVAAHVFSDGELTRGSGPLDEAKRREIGQNLRVDTRVPKLARISGKGGWSPDPNKRASRAVFTNVTLLDHLASVVRGALQFAEMNLAAKHSLDPAVVRRRLAVVAAVAFLHDGDKMLEHAGRGQLTVGEVEELMGRFGIGAFLRKHDAALTALEMLTLIELVETSQAGRLHALPRAYLDDCAYVQLADRLDGIFLKTRPTQPGDKVGIAGVLKEIGEFSQAGAVRLDAKGGWRVLELRDPHTPFLADAFQAALSAACGERHGFPPLIELHHDGRLVMVVPQEGSEALITHALGRVAGQLGARIQVYTTDRGTVRLLDAPGTLDDLRDAVIDMRRQDREKVLRGSTRALRAHSTAIDAFLAPAGFLPRMPDLASYSHKLVSIWSSLGEDDEIASSIHRDAVLLNAVLSCKEDAPARLGIPDAARRERELREVLGGLPSFLDELPPDTRRALLSGYAAGMARADDALHDALFGPDGLAAAWLEGRDGRPGLASTIQPANVRLRDAVTAHYTALLGGAFVGADETAEGRCHFTNAPVPRTTRIDGKMGLYGVSVSAFSGREGRPESFHSSQAETLVSEVAEAEHRLRKRQFRGDSKSAQVPIQITSPTTAGLFGALLFANDEDAAEFMLLDLAQAKLIPDRLAYNSVDALLRRTRIARYEELPTRLTGEKKDGKRKAGQAEFFGIVFDAALRTGRPLHLFRGLPHPRPEFVAFDALPQPIEALLQDASDVLPPGTGFRLEQIGRCRELLRGIEDVADATGFGQELALRLCVRKTRFGAACDALSRAERRLANDRLNQTLQRISAFTTNILGEASFMSEESTIMQSNDRAIVAFGDAMAFAQRLPNAGANVAELGLRTALDTVETLGRLGQTADESLLAGVAGELSTVLDRRGLLSKRELLGARSRSEVIEAAASIFVRQVWHGAFKATPPSSRERRVALAVYRFAFQRASKRLYNSSGLEADQESSED